MESVFEKIGGRCECDVDCVLGGDCYSNDFWVDQSVRLYKSHTYSFSTFIYPKSYHRHAHSVRHLIEHHGVACLSMAFISRSISKYLEGKGEKVDIKKVSPSHISVLQLYAGIGYTAQICEAYWVFRTFVCKPEAWIHRTIQRVLGLIFMGSSILGGNVMIFSVIREMITHGKFQRDPALCLPILMYFFYYLQPKYFMTHLDKLKILLSTRR